MTHVRGDVSVQCVSFPTAAPKPLVTQEVTQEQLSQGPGKFQRVGGVDDLQR